MTTPPHRPPFLRTITSKGQITVPATLVRSQGWQAGDTLAVTALDEDPPSFIVRRVNLEEEAA